MEKYSKFIRWFPWLGHFYTFLDIGVYMDILDKLFPVRGLFCNLLHYPVAFGIVATLKEYAFLPEANFLLFLWDLSFMDLLIR